MRIIVNNFIFDLDRNRFTFVGGNTQQRPGVCELQRRQSTSCSVGSVTLGYEVGDRFAIRREGNVLRYLQNGLEVWRTNNAYAVPKHRVVISMEGVMGHLLLVNGADQDVQKEVPIYGSARLGQYTGGVAEGHRTLGHRSYELSNHLGNVLAVITDNVNMNQNDIQATVTSTSDYYPFGLEMKGRSYSDTIAYRYGFNGKEKDNMGASVYDYGFRIYNPRIGKWLSIDPLLGKYPGLTPYCAFENNPVYFIDSDGRDAIYSIKGNTITVSTVIHIYGSGASEAKRLEIQNSIMKKWKGGKFKGEDGKIYNIKFNVSVTKHSEMSISKFKSEIKDGENVAFIDNNMQRSEVKNGYYGHFNTNDIGASHEFGHMLGLNDHYFDEAHKKVDINCKEDCEYFARGKDLEGVLPDDIMGKNARDPSAKVTQSELSAVGNKILSLKREKGVLRAKGLRLDTPGSLPDTAPMDIDPKQLEKLAGYGSRTYEPKSTSNKK